MSTKVIDVGFTGTRAGCTLDQKHKLDDVLAELQDAGAVWMHNGDAIGADLEAAWAWWYIGGKIHLRPCTHKDRAFFELYQKIEKPKAPLDRNRDIVTACDVLVAISATMEETPRGGTWSTIRYADARKKKIIIIFPNGSIEKRNFREEASNVFDRISSLSTNT